jgi:predicted tellurium resistance membrane protein TerC
MLALSFLLVVGVMLVAEGFDTHVPKGYIYFAMAFSLAVETLNIRSRRKRLSKQAPVHLHEPYERGGNGKPGASAGDSH